MSEFEKFFEVKFPNIQATIDQSHCDESILLKKACRMTWNARQSEIDQLKYERDAFQEFHRDCKAEIDQLTGEFEEDKRFLKEAIQSKDTQIEKHKYIQKSDEMLIASQKKRVDQLNRLLIDADLNFEAAEGEIDQLKKQLNDSEYLKVQHRERRCELSKEVEKLKAEKAGLEKRVDGALSQLESGSFVVNDLRKTLRGESFLEYLDRTEQLAEKMPDSIKKSVREGLGMGRGEHE